MIIILAGTFIALAFFYYLQQKRRIRKEQKMMDNKEKFERLLGYLKVPKQDQNAEECDATKAS